MGEGIANRLLDRMCLTNQNGEYFHHSRLIKKSTHFVFYRAAISMYFLAWLIAQTAKAGLICFNLTFNFTIVHFFRGVFVIILWIFIINSF